MKKILAIVFCVICFVAFAACGSQADTPSNTSSVQAPAVEKTDNEQVIKAFEGEYSKEKFKEAIEVYKYHCKPIEVNDKCSVVFRVDFDIKYCSASHHTVIESDPDRELGFYDSMIPCTVTDGVVAVYTGNWYGSDSNQSDVQSFLVRVADENKENIQYYYFRVKYNEKAESERSEPVTVPDGFDYSQWQIRINNRLYKATDKVGDIYNDFYESLATIMGTVKEGTEPGLNGFTNFGVCGNSYTYNKDGDAIALTPDGAWRFFEAAE